MIDFECAGGLQADRNRISFGAIPTLVCLSFDRVRRAAKAGEGLQGQGHQVRGAQHPGVAVQQRLLFCTASRSPRTKTTSSAASIRAGSGLQGPDAGAAFLAPPKSRHPGLGAGVGDVQFLNPGKAVALGSAAFDAF